MILHRIYVFPKIIKKDINKTKKEMIRETLRTESLLVKYNTDFHFKPLNL